MAKMGISPKTLMHPSDDWVQWTRAPFFFVPAMATSPAAWQEGMSSIVRSVLGQKCQQASIKQSADYVLELALDRVKLEIDASRGYFRLRTADFDDEESDYFMGGPYISGPPHEFFDRSPFEDISARDRPAWDGLRGLAQTLWPMLSEHFNLAIRSRRARIMARPSDPLAGFQEIAPDQLRCFTPVADQNAHDEDDNILDIDMSGRNGATLYSVRVAPGRTSTIAKMSTAATETRAARFIAAELRASANGKVTKAEMRKKVLAEGIEIQGRGFDRAWKLGLKTAGLEELAKGGRPSRKTSAPANLRTN
jgi:hypothetical protein